MVLSLLKLLENNMSIKSLWGKLFHKEAEVIKECEHKFSDWENYRGINRQAYKCRTCKKCEYREVKYY